MTRQQMQFPVFWILTCRNLEIKKFWDQNFFVINCVSSSFLNLVQSYVLNRFLPWWSCLACHGDKKIERSGIYSSCKSCQIGYQDQLLWITLFHTKVFASCYVSKIYSILVKKLFIYHLLCCRQKLKTWAPQLTELVLLEKWKSIKFHILKCFLLFTTLNLHFYYCRDKE